MSKINALRLINLNYNNNAIRINDETFHFNGESTLLSLRNGGGKSVLVQMITAPFVHQRYRNAKDRPFESYFTTNKPTFILVEWVLDQGAGYVLTGMMVRRSQEDRQDNQEALEIVNFISEYKERCQQDIYHLPVVEKTSKGMILKNFGACRQLFEACKRDHSMKFFYYDMNNHAQTRQYFDKLKEYQIDYKEWETIIKKVNLKESGLSDLFADCRDEKGLVEKWFLDAVESKLNKDRNHMKEFQSILEKYVGQYKDNQSKIQRRDTIQRFKEEAEGILQRAEAYLEGSRLEQVRRDKIVSFREVLTDLSTEAAEKLLQAEEEWKKLKEEELFTEYEQLSADIYKLKEEESFHISNRDMIGMELDALNRECEAVRKKIYALICAGARDDAEEERREYKKIWQRLEVSRNENEDLEPERRMLGSLLWNYFHVECEKETDLFEQKQKESFELTEKIQREKERRETLQKDIGDVLLKQGAVQASVKGYDERENSFNRRYQCSLNRNILGEYEPGEMEIRGKELRKELENLKREKLAGYKRQEELEENIRSLNRNLSDGQQDKLRKEQKISECEKEQEFLEGELKERRRIMRYLEIPLEQIFDTESILNITEHKIQEIGRMRRSLEKEEDELQKEYVRLTQGKVLELPEEFADLLNNLGLNYVFGMDYLNRNGNTAAENCKLVKAHPFLPYALILSEKEMKKLAEHTGEVYTSFPIPIVLRESLEESVNQDGRVIDFPQVSFYLLFNENLLDEEKLAQMVRVKEKELEQKRDAIRVRGEEYNDYLKKREKIASQKITKEGYEAQSEKRKNLKDELSGISEEIHKMTIKLSEAENESKNLKRKLEREEKEYVLQERRLEDFETLQELYSGYLKNRHEAERLSREIERLNRRMKLSMQSLEEMDDRWKSLEIEKEEHSQKIKDSRSKLLLYTEYEDENCKDVPAASVICDAEARYQAITSKFSAEIQLLEEQAAGAGKRLDKAENRLKNLQEKYGLKREDWEEAAYSAKEEKHQEELLQEKERSCEKKKELFYDEDTNVKVIAQQVKDRISELRNKVQKEVPLPKKEIRTTDFQAKLKELEYQLKEVREDREAWERKERSYGENLTALEEFADDRISEPIEWEKNFREMTQKKLREFSGLLVRDYRESVKECQEKRNRFVDFLNKILRMEIFQDPFYRQPLEHMLELNAQAEMAVSQLNTTLSSYDRLMEKLEVDISMVEKEKAKIVELLDDYLYEVHENIGRIDSNSTITIREKPVKMLKIQLPDWEKNAGLYRVRLNDFIDELTQKGLEIFDKNENALEYFGSRMTTKNLYDQVVGIANVQIRLYKVEEQREYPITWAEVAKNSGGEGFLSAFIILTSLLYYMRKDETDLFAEKNEGKVLVMDNPFAQTNAAHLLKPLMDMAKKTNTQLICLSGLGGESIYNRFDNIYVLNLVAANLRGGMQYLRADHKRGSEPDTMILSRIEVMNQEELIF